MLLFYTKATCTYPLAIVVEEGLEFYNVWMADNSHDLKLTILIRRHGQLDSHAMPQQRRMSYFEPLVLQDSFDRGIFSAGRQLRLEDNPERAIPDDFALGIGKISVFSGNAVLDFLVDDFCSRVRERGQRRNG
jgi:hypothetical protein